MIAAVPSWNATIGVCAPLASFAIAMFYLCLRDSRDFEVGERAQRTRHRPLPLSIFGGLPVAITAVVLFVSVAHRDERLEATEAAVLGAATGVIALLIAIDLIRSSRQQRMSMPPSR